ncbi:MAG: pimeloyl-ACP methyl ester esterase BioH [Steroidobacteraceae bacterium]
MRALYQESFGEDNGAAPLVLLHGWALNLRVFDALAGQLATGRRVIRIDLPGHGRSTWDTSLAPFGKQFELLLGALPERCDLLGWSLGGLYSMALAAREPERIGKLVLVACTPRFEATEGWAQGMAAPVVQQFANTLLANYKQGVKDFLELQVRGSSNAEYSLAQLQRALLAHGDAQPSALNAGLAILRRVDLRGQLAGIRAPALVIAGQYDRVARPAASEFIAQQIPGAQYLLMHRAAHAPFLSHPDEFASAVAGFLA